MAADNGTEARLDRAEKDVGELFHRVNKNAEKLAQVPFIEREVREIRSSCQESHRMISAASEALRIYVEERLEADRKKAATEKRERQEREIEERRLSLTQVGILVGAVATVVAALVAAIASLAAAGVL